MNNMTKGPEAIKLFHLFFSIEALFLKYKKEHTSPSNRIITGISKVTRLVAIANNDPIFNNK